MEWGQDPQYLKVLQKQQAKYDAQGKGQVVAALASEPKINARFVDFYHAFCLCRKTQPATAHGLARIQLGEIDDYCNLHGIPEVERPEFVEVIMALDDTVDEFTRDRDAARARIHRETVEREKARAEAEAGAPGVVTKTSGG